MILNCAVQPTQSRKVLGRKADAVEERYLALITTTPYLATKNLPKLNNRMIGVELLDLALDASLFGILYEDVRSHQDVAMQLRLAGAVATDGIHMHACTNHVVSQDRGVLLICSAGSDYVGAKDSILSTGAFDDLKPGRAQVACATLYCSGIDVVKPHNV